MLYIFISLLATIWQLLYADTEQERNSNS